MPDSSAQRTSILLVDDHALFRESVGRLLTSEPGFEVSALCGSIEEALAALQKARVDIVLLDYDLGQRDGREFIRLARQLGFAGKVLVVTAAVGKKKSTAFNFNCTTPIFFINKPAALYFYDST